LEGEIEKKRKELARQRGDADADEESEVEDEQAEERMGRTLQKNREEKNVFSAEKGLRKSESEHGGDCPGMTNYKEKIGRERPGGVASESLAILREGAKRKSSGSYPRYGVKNRDCMYQESQELKTKK